MENEFSNLFDLTGKVALVTGASKGIGEAMARGMAAFGARVVVSSRKQASLDAIAASIRADGGEAAAIATHMGDNQAIHGLVAQCAEKFGGVDILVNNAAANPVFGPLMQLPVDACDKIMSVNFKGPLELSRLVQPHMASRGGGSIINISSIGGISPEPMLALYSASKAALINLTKAMAREWGKDNIRVNAICPGLVQTKFSAALWQNDAILTGFLKEIPLGRIAQPKEMVGLAIFLASAAGSYCTGGFFTVDGGFTA